MARAGFERRVGVVGVIAAGLWSHAAAQPGSRGEPEPEPAGEIRVTRDFVAKLNARIEAIPRADRAWPVYLKANALFEPVPDHWWDDPAFAWPASPETPGWKEIAAYVDRNAWSAALIREASKRPVLGAAIVLDRRADDQSIPSFAQVNAVDSERMLRMLFRFIETDMHRAIELGNSRRAADDAIAYLVLGRHVASGNELASVLSGSSIESHALYTMSNILRSHPDSFDDDDLVRISRVLTTKPAPHLFDNALEYDHAKFLDTVQRVFTDDGRGGGVFSPWAWRDYADQLGYFHSTSWTHRFEIESREDQLSAMDTWQRVAPERSNFVHRFEESLASVRASLAFEPWDERAWAWFMAQPELSWGVDAHGRVREPSFGGFEGYRLARAVAVECATQRDAARIAIALIRHRREHGSDPQSLDELVPAFLDEVPRDPMDGRPLRYRLVDGSPRVYSLGPDRDDDGGRGWSGRPEIRPYIRLDQDPIDGDWILYPMLDE